MRPSTTVEEYAFLARKQLSIRLRCDCSIFVLAFIGAMPLGMTISHSISRRQTDLVERVRGRGLVGRPRC